MTELDLTESVDRVIMTWSQRPPHVLVGSNPVQMRGMNDRKITTGQEEVKAIKSEGIA